MIPVSACLIVKNEEQVLEPCLKDLSEHVDEIIVLDSGSEDKTVEIAKRYTNKVFQRNFDDFSSQRNHCISLAKNFWILAIDADEILSPDLWQKIEELFKQGIPPGVVVYCFPSETFTQAGELYLEVHSYPGFRHRLYDKRYCFYEGFVHERLIFNGKRKFISSPMWHYHDFSREDQKKEFYLRLKQLEKEAHFQPRELSPFKRAFKQINSLFFFTYCMLFRMGFLWKGPRYWKLTIAWISRITLECLQTWQQSLLPKK